LSPGRQRRGGQRAIDRQAASGSAGPRDTALTVAALIPAVLLWVMALAGSQHGLVAFGRSTLGWRGGWEYLVPGTLDGVSVTFALLAFRAVRKQKSPVRCQRVVWGAAIAPATVNVAYEYGSSSHNVVAGGYLGLLSLFGMVMFHEFLAQFEDAHAAAVVAALVPNIASWATGQIDNSLAAANTSAAAVGETALQSSGVVYHGLQMLGQGAILAGLVFGAIVAFIIDKRFVSAAVFSGAGAVLSFVGLIHGEKVQWNANGSVALGYLFVAAVCGAFALTKPAPRVPDEEELVLDHLHGVAPARPAPVPLAVAAD
jgi:hypothetical protein